MNKQLLLEKYAKLAVKIGLNVQKDQMVMINSSIDCAEFTRAVVKAAYEVGASYVMVEWSDGFITKTFYEYATEEQLKEIPDYIVDKFKYFTSKGGCSMSIASPNPELMKDIDPKKMMIQRVASQQKMEFMRKYSMENHSQWLVVAYPSAAWAKKVFPNLGEEEGQEKLLEAILKACRVSEDNDPVEAWNEHMEKLAKHNKLLNEYNFESLHFKNSLGTDLDVTLVDNHIWSGGGEYTRKNVYFAPNIPTEETFTMPHSQKVNGKVVSTKPLSFQGKLIENFFLEFKDGEVVNFGAEKEQEALGVLLNTDPGSKRLGEVALISHDSPISNMNILFYNTLFDENASCHLALGNAYTMNLKDSDKMTEEELISKGYNKSMVHVDFMFGSEDMEIIGTTKDGKQVQVFKNGNFVF